MASGACSRQRETAAARHMHVGDQPEADEPCVQLRCTRVRDDAGHPPPPLPPAHRRRLPLRPLPDRHGRGDGERPHGVRAGGVDRRLQGAHLGAKCQGAIEATWWRNATAVRPGLELPLHLQQARRSPCPSERMAAGWKASEAPWVASSITFRLLHSDKQTCPMGSASFPTLLNGLTVIPLSHLSYLVGASGCRPKACWKRSWRLEMPAFLPSLRRMFSNAARIDPQCRHSDTLEQLVVGHHSLGIG